MGSAAEAGAAAGGRQRLPHFSTLEHVVERLHTAKKIIVVSGAGISVSTGIPDFRSRDGLYNTLDCAKIGIPSAGGLGLGLGPHAVCTACTVCVVCIGFLSCSIASVAVTVTLHCI